MSLADRLHAIRARIEAATAASGRAPGSVRLVAISKNFPEAAILEAYAAGQRVFGESRVQEALEKIGALPQPDLEWHLVGHLQTNKARRAAGAFSVIQSVDSLELLRRLDTAALGAGTRPALLIQVDLAAEATKFGAPPSEVPALLEAAATAQAVRVVGLMTIPPAPEQPEDSRPWFRRLRELRDAWLAAGVPAHMLEELSMGMSDDFEVAIEEGATLVRVGTAIFGARAPAARVDG